MTAMDIRLMLAGAVAIVTLVAAVSMVLAMSRRHGQQGRV
jgi:hypothetical protein